MRWLREQLRNDRSKLPDSSTGNNKTCPLNPSKHPFEPDLLFGCVWKYATLTFFACVIFFREREKEKLAATAKSNAKRNHVVRFHPPLDQGAYVVKPRKARGVRSLRTTCGDSSSPTEYAPDPYGIPKHRRPPTPPSESELDWRRRSMGLGI